MRSEDGDGIRLFPTERGFRETGEGGEAGADQRRNRVGARNLARRTADEIAALDGTGSSVMPVLRGALKKQGPKIQDVLPTITLRLVFACVQLCYTLEIPT